MSEPRESASVSAIICSATLADREGAGRFNLAARAAEPDAGPCAYARSGICGVGRTTAGEVNGVLERLDIRRASLLSKTPALNPMICPEILR